MRGETYDLYYYIINSCRFQEVFAKFSRNPVENVFFMQFFAPLRLPHE